MEAFPEAQFTVQMVKAMKEKHASVADQVVPAVVKLPVNGKPTEFDERFMAQAASAALPPRASCWAPICAAR